MDAYNSSLHVIQILADTEPFVIQIDIQLASVQNLLLVIHSELALYLKEIRRFVNQVLVVAIQNAT